jgi:uncharacterized small protein (DUF1192 family)
MEQKEIFNSLKKQAEGLLNIVEELKKAMPKEEAERLEAELKKKHQDFEMPNFSFGQAMDFLDKMNNKNNTK